MFNNLYIQPPELFQNYCVFFSQITVQEFDVEPASLFLCTLPVKYFMPLLNSQS